MKAVTVTSFILCLSVFLSACSSSSSAKKSICEYNDECPAGYKCTSGKCVDIHNPFLGGPKR